ncbi:hypothetical protein OSB04_008346 [Centaurea solstitialis]|uniref:Uncharacterized protein n=1 Tax=Centaurea solstitialis TaxID=347529 RepID=A0AA38TX47_9ASTR|nr:hypothetical protein OSB04_008346 [Centaurea solstitialis]
MENVTRKTSDQTESHEERSRDKHGPVPALLIDAGNRGAFVRSLFHVQGDKSQDTRLVSRLPFDPFSVGSVAELLDNYRDGSNANSKKVTVGALMAADVWGIWNTRNLLVFNKKGTPLSIIASEVISNAYLWIKARARKREGLIWENWCITKHLR